MPQIQDTECMIFLDEAHELPKKLVVAFLSILNTEKKTVVHYTHQDVEYVFDFSKINFVFATTEMDRLCAPFKDRLTVIDFTPYSNSEVKDIIKKRIPAVKFAAGVLDDIATTIRGNARSAVKRAKEVEMFCERKNNTSFSLQEWSNLRHEVNINKNGLTNTEIQVLRVLKDRGPSTLTMLSAVTGMSRTSLQRDVETHLLKVNYLRIEGTRQITGSGLTFLEQIG